jgi:hypothetical protein
MSSIRQTDLPTSFECSSSARVGVSGIKYSSIVEVNGTFRVFVNTVKQAGHNLVYFSFTEFTQAAAFLLSEHRVSLLITSAADTG